MSQLITRLANVWLEKVNPRITSFISFFGALWLGVCALTIYILVNLSDEVLEQPTFAADKAILLYIHQFSNPFLDNLMLGITSIGDPRTVVPLTLIVFCLLWAKRHRIEAKFFAINAVGGAVLSYVLKLTFSKPRPDLWPQLITETTFSYPSGHALGAMVLYGFLSYVLASFYPQYKKASYGVAGILIAAIGLSRLYLGVHWPTDIVGGYGIGFLWITICITLMRLQKAKGENR